MRIFSPGFFLLLACTFVSARAQAPAYEANAKYTAAMQDAARLTKTHQYAFAIDALKKANKAAEGKSRPCLDQLYELQVGLGDYKDSIATAAQLQVIAETPQQKSSAEMKTGQALLKQAGDKPKPAQMDAAHSALQAALTDYPKNITARYNRCLPAGSHGQNGRCRQGVCYVCGRRFACRSHEGAGETLCG